MYGRILDMNVRSKESDQYYQPMALRGYKDIRVETLPREAQKLKSSLSTETSSDTI